MRLRARAAREEAEAGQARPSVPCDLSLAAVLGIVQGLTEFLPISSTAHLLLVGEPLGFEDPGGVFTVMIQFGSVLAVMWLYRAKIIGVVPRADHRIRAARRFALHADRRVDSGRPGRRAARRLGEEPAV